VSRRDAVTAGGAVLLAGLLNVSPAQAFLGIGEGAQRAEAYKSDTVRKLMPWMMKYDI